MCCFLLLQSSSIYAEETGTEESPYTIRHYTDENGLPQNSVKYIARDEHGFLWLATENGLTRFDGRQFLNFNAANLPVRGSRIFFLYPDAEKYGIRALTGRNERLFVWNGRVYVEKSGRRDFFYLKDKDPEGIYCTAGLPDVGLEANGDEHFMYPAGPDSWFNVYRDTVRFEENGTARHELTIPGLMPWRVFVLEGAFCYVDDKGRCTIFNNGKGYTTKITGEMRDESGDAQFFSNMAAGQVFAYRNGDCYRLKFMQDGSLGSTLVQEGFDFKKNSIISLYHDEIHQRLFLGSGTKGLYISTRKQFHTLKSGGEENEVYYAQAPYGNSGILTATGVIFDSIGARRIPLMQKIRTDWDNYSITRDGRGTYWYKNGERLFRLSNDLKSVLWMHVFKEEITQLYIDKKERLWIGGMKNGLYVLDTKDTVPSLQLYTNRIIDPSYIIEESPEIFWFGTVHGLFRMNMSTRQVDTFKELSGKYVRSIFIPAKGEVWITTYNDGIFLYRNNRFIQLPLDRRQYIATAHCIVCGPNGYLWITTNKGLFQISRRDALSYADGLQQELFYFYYGKDQGFYTNEFNGGCEPCALQLANGAVSLPSLDGLVYFDPVKIQAELPEQGIFLDRVELDAEMTDVTDTISLPNNFRQLKLSFSSPYFGDPGNLLLHYSLREEGSGQERLWLPIAAAQEIEFPTMSSGVYELRIKKVNGFGKGNSTEKIFRITVQQAYYETTWFRLLAGGLVAVLGLLFSWLRIRRERRKNRQLEMHVSTRTRELKATLNNLQSSERQLRKQAFMQQRLLAAISHDIRTPLGFLITVLGDGSREGTEIKGEERSVARESLQRMFLLVENLIRYMKSRFMVDNSSLEIVDLHQLLEEKSGLFRPVSHAKGVCLLNDTAPDTQVLVNEQLLSVIVHNLLDNAVKYTKDGRIKIKAFSNGEEIHILLTDTGAGMPEALMDWINQYGRNDHFPQTPPGIYNGLGLLIVMELLQLINGRMVVSRNMPEGTMIVLTLQIVR